VTLLGTAVLADVLEAESHRRCHQRALSLVDGSRKGLKRSVSQPRGRVRTPADCRWSGALISGQ